MEGAHVASIDLEMTLGEFTEIIEAYLQNGFADVAVKDGSMKVEFVKLYPPTIIGTDYENNRVIRIESIKNKVIASIIEDESYFPLFSPS